MTFKFAALAAVLAFTAVPALAQGGGAPGAGANAVRIAGATVDKIDGNSLTVKTNDGMTQTLTLAPDLVVFANKKATMADIKNGDYVASAAVKGTDGKLHSTEVRIFPDAMRGNGEGQRPMNDAQNQTMTNATVTGAVSAGTNRSLAVQFQGGTSELIVGPEVPVTAIVAAAKADVKVGAKVQVNGVKNADGSQTAQRITIQ